MYSNIRGYRSKRTSLIQILEEVKRDIVLLKGTNLKGNTTINVPRYKAVCRNRKISDDGGLAILVNNSIKQNKFIHKIEDNNMECVWIRLGQNTAQPIYIALYYGKQENENKEVINDEIFNLSTEIKRAKINIDKILVIGDRNAKVAVQPTCEDSRNGKIIRNLINENNLIITNYTDKCVGKWTRVNANNKHEKSVIDYCLSTKEMFQDIIKMTIHDDGLYKPIGRKPTDHNTIILDVTNIKINEAFHTKKVWKMSDSTDWKTFAQNLSPVQYCMNNSSSKSENSTKLYESFTSSINQVARKVIGRKTIKYSHKGTLTQQIPKELRREKALARKEYEAANKSKVNAEITKSKEKYFILQDRVRSAMVENSHNM